MTMSRMQAGVYMVGDPYLFAKPGASRALGDEKYIRFFTDKDYGPIIDSDGYVYLMDTSRMGIMRIDDETLGYISDEAIEKSLRGGDFKLIHKRKEFDVYQKDNVIHIDGLRIYCGDDHYCWPGDDDYDDPLPPEILKKEYR